MATKIKTNHAFTKKQLESLNVELKKISNVQIQALRGIEIPSLDNFADIEILKSNFLLDVFLKFLDVSNPDYPKSFLYQIDTKGFVNKHAKQTLEFNNFQDRITFFSDLEPIEFNY